MGCYIWYSEDGPGRGRSPARSLLAVPNVTAHPSTTSVPIAVLAAVALRFLSRVSILTRNIDIANLSVRLSVTLRYSMEMA